MKYILIAFLFSQTSHASVCGIVTFSKGQVDLLRLQKKEGQESPVIRHAIKAQRKSKVHCNDIIVTGEKSRAKVNLKRISITLSPKSRFHVSKFNPQTKEANLLNLTYGKLRALIKKKKKKEPDQGRIRFKTPAAVVGVRGTDFYVSYDPNTMFSDQATLTGEVEVTQNVTGQSVIVTPGNQVSVLNVKAKIDVQMQREKQSVEIRKQRAIDRLKAKNLSKDNLEKKIAAIERKSGQLLKKKGKQIESKVIKKANDTPLNTLAMEEHIKANIREVSSIARNDKNFANEKVEKLIGPASEWKIPKEEIPEEFKGIKNEY